MELIKTLKENPYFSAGFGLFGVGALAAVGRKCVTVGVVVFKRHYVTTLGNNKIVRKVSFSIARRFREISRAKESPGAVNLDIIQEQPFQNAYFII